MWYNMLEFERKEVMSQLNVPGRALVHANDQQEATDPPEPGLLLLSYHSSLESP